MKKTTCILSVIVLALTLWAVALWLLPFGDYNDNVKETRYGMNEGMEVVEQTVADGQRRLSGNLVGISINLCKSIQKELFINDTP